MFLAKRFRARRVLSVAAAGSMVAATALVVATPASAAEIYPRPWDNIVTLSGQGYGHGHGMSQWGAYGAAKVGKLSWANILAFYYPGTTLTRLTTSTIRVRLDAVGSGILYVPNAVGLQLSYPGRTTPVSLKQVDSARKPITRYRVRTLATTGRLRVEALSSAGWKTYTDLSSPASFSNKTAGNLVTVVLKNKTARTYRGRIVANWASASAITPVNVLPMESYLRAVVPAEMPSAWHPNALAAQAVAARSYANHNRENAPAGRAFDTCDTTACQMYSGLTAEATSTNAAIAATAGRALTYQGAAAFTQFSASNGGWSTAGSRPYLVARADRYDGAIPNGSSAWTKSVTVATIQARWPSIGSYQRLRITSRDGHGRWGGRVLQAVVEGSAGSVTVTGPALRFALGLKSEWFVPTNLRSAPSYPRDLTGDKLADVLGVVAGTGYLRLYAGNGASGWKSMTVAGTGFKSFSKVFTAGTWDVDALSDVIAQKADGTLWLYPGGPAGRLGAPRRIGSGWGGFNLVFPAGDFGGDGLSDLLARTPDGTLMLYSGNGSGGFLKARKIGAAWGVFTTVFSPGDFDGDAKSDVIARSADGTLYLYPGNGVGGWLPRRLIGPDWNTYTSITSPGDLDGDRRSDLLARSTDGNLWLHPGDGTGGVLPRTLVGSGWNIFSTVLP